MVLLASIAAILPLLGCRQAPATAKTDPPMTLAEARKYVDPFVRWTPPKIDPKQNGWDLMVKATQHIPNSSGYLEPGSRVWRNPKGTPESPSDLLGLINKPGEKDIVKRCQKALVAYQPALDAIREATNRPYWYAPNLAETSVPKPFGATSEMTFPVNAKVKDLCKTLVLSANLNMKLKKPQAAADDLILCHKIADRMVECHKDLITLLVGFAADSIACRPIQTLCADPTMQIRDLQRILSNLQERRMGTDLVATLKSEHDRYFVTTIASVTYPSKEIGFQYGDQGDISKKLLEDHPYPLNRKATLELGSSLYKKVVERVMQPYGKKENLDNLGATLLQGWPPDLLDFGDDTREKVLTASEIELHRSQLAKIDNPLGKVLVSMLLPVFIESDQADTRAVANTRVTRIILAIQIFKRQTGKYPSKLDELVAKGILEAVPLDPFVNQPFQYDHARKVVWSIGVDLKDDGGKDRVGSVDGKDYVWPVDGVFPKSISSMPVAPPPIGGPGAPPMK